MLYNGRILCSTKHCLFSHIEYIQKSGLHMYNRIMVYTKTHLDIITDTYLVFREALIIEVMGMMRISRYSRRKVGQGSREHDLVGESRMILVT